MRPAEEIVWPGGSDSFRLGIGELRALEKACDAGCAVVLARLLSTAWKIDDIYQPIRLGLIGAGMDAKAATDRMELALTLTSPYGLAVTAADILQRFIMWGEEDAPGETVAGEANQS